MSQPKYYEPIFDYEDELYDNPNREREERGIRHQLETQWLFELESGKALDSAPLEAELKRRQKK